MHAFGPLLATGEIEAARRELEAARHVARELRQPAHLWDVGGAAAMLALSDGRLAEGEALVEEVREIGERAQADMAIPVYLMQRYALCDLQGRLEEIEPSIADLVAQRPSRPVFRCVTAHLQARLGRLGEAGAALGELARDRFSVLPFDQEWRFGMSVLAETAALVGDVDSASVLFDLLAPWRALNVVDQCEGMRGSVSRYLGILAATTERVDEAERYFEAALAMNALMGARPWLAHTRSDYARWLEARGRAGDRERAQALSEAALAALRELGLAGAAAHHAVG
jgi:tetratricopeptide (TPR) repeat protein